MTTEAPPADRTDVPPSSTSAIPAALWGIATVITFGAFMSGLDTSLVNVGLNTIGHDLHAPLTSTQWITSAYLLALAGALPASGWLSRRVGAGRLWLWSLGGFTIASGLCALAPSIDVLVAARVLQGIAGGLLVSTGITVLATVAGPGRMGRILAITGVPTVLAPALGPTVGALLIAELSWPWLFVINLPIGVVAVLLGLRFVPRGERAATNALDLPGLVLVAAGLPLLTYGITQAAQRQSVTALAALVPLLTGAAALTLFARRSLHRTSPLLDLRLFTNRVYTAAACQTVFGGAALFGGQIVMPLYFQLQRSQPIVDTGLLLLPFGLGAAATFPLAGRLTDRYSGGRVAAAGLAITALATIPMTVLGAHANLVGVEALQVLRGIGLAMAGAPVIAAAMVAIARHQLADASAVINILARVGGALGSALLVVILTNTLPHTARGAAATAAFHTTFWWLTAAAIAALAGSAWLVFEQRRNAPGTTRTAASPATGLVVAISTKEHQKLTTIAIIVGSTRPGRKADAVARWVHDLAVTRDDATFEIVDLADYPLPLLDEAAGAGMGPLHYSHPHTKDWAARIAPFDGYVFVTPEYNHSTSGVLKNAIDFLYTEWNNKAAGFVSYGSVGGTRAVEHLRLIMAELQVADVRSQVALSLFTDFGGGTDLKPGPHQAPAVTAMLDQLIAWADALAPLRSS